MVTQLIRNSEPATMRPSISTRPREPALRSAGNSSSPTQAPTGNSRNAASAGDGNGVSWPVSS